jgi:hypothetical protein
VVNVIDVRAGLYDYVSSEHVLRRRSDTAPGQAIQRMLHNHSVNLELAAFVVHVAAALDFRGSVRGARQYRVQQMLVGTAVDAITLASAALAAGSHPLLGFDSAQVNRLYGFGDGYSAMAQVAVGRTRTGGALEGSVW